MKIRNTAMMGLAGLVGLVGSVKLLINENEKHNQAREQIPARYFEIQEELENSRVNFTEFSIYDLVRLSEAMEMVKKYTPLIQEMDSYRNDTNLQPVIRDYEHSRTGPLIASAFGISLGLAGISIAETLRQYKLNKKSKK